jgi:hypothetical protein
MKRNGDGGRDAAGRRGGAAEQRQGRGGPAAGLLLGASLAVLAGCSSIEPALTTPADSYVVAGGTFGRPWGGQPPQQILDDSVTIGRLRGGEPSGEHLLPEPGNVWPGPLPPRTTLANPDAALRGVPEFPGPTSSMPTTEPTRGAMPSSSSGPPRGLPQSSLAPTVRPTPASGSTIMSVPPAPQFETAPRADGRVLMTPNGPVVTTGGTSRVQSTMGANGQAGVAVRDGNFTTVTPIGGVPQPAVPNR